MANKRPDIYEHNNPDRAFVDSDFVRGGARTPVADRDALYALVTKADQLKVGATTVRVLADADNGGGTTEVLLVDATNIDNEDGWQLVVATPGGPGTPGGSDIISDSLSGGQALAANTSPAPKLLPGRRYALTADNWNLSTTPVQATVYVDALTPSEFATAGYVLDTQGVIQFVDVDVPAGTVDTKAIRDNNLIPYGQPYLDPATNQLIIPLLQAATVPPDAVIEVRMIP